VEGPNPSGKLLLVNKLYQTLPLPFHVTEQSNPIPFSVIVAAGPWTTSDNMEYAPLDAFLNEVSNNPPEVLILVGPFVDTDHPFVQSGVLPETFEQKLEIIIQKIIERANEWETTKIIIIPSLKDASHPFVFPQPPFEVSPELKEKTTNQILFYPHPATFTVNGVSCGISSNDILFHLNQDQASSLHDTDRLGKMCEHVITQRSYYPLYPPSVQAANDMCRLEFMDFPFTPDILLLPSDLKFFVKNTKDVLCINPGRITKGKTPGTFARFTVHSKTETAIRVVERTRVNIVRV